MSSDNGLILKRDTSKEAAYSIHYYGSGPGETFLESSNDIFTILASAEKQQDGTEYNVRLEGFVDVGDN